MLSSREDKVRGQNNESKWKQGELSAWSRRKAGGEVRSHDSLLHPIEVTLRVLQIQGLNPAG